jgi:pyruvate/2-oxoglutarate dehydrogenase complex dihydrolipoamide dehydrogenase (E3) component
VIRQPLQADPRVNFAAVMNRVREMRAFSGSFDAVSVAAGAGIDVFLGDGQFVGPDAVEVDGQRLRFRRALIATGSRPAVPDLPGLAAAAYLTNETVFELTELPRRVVCVGAGIVNCELAQALRRLGSEVDLVGSGRRLLPSEAPAASDLLARRRSVAEPNHEGEVPRRGRQRAADASFLRFLALGPGGRLVESAQANSQGGS